MLYPLLSSLTIAAEDEFFSTSESIYIYCHTKPDILAVLRDERIETLSVCSFLKVTIKIKVCIVTMRKCKTATKHDVFSDANDLNRVI